MTIGYAAYQALVLDDKLASNQVLQSDSVISKLPDVAFTKFGSQEKVKLRSEFEGKNLVVHFWATWCGPCEAEFPRFQTLFESVSLPNTIFMFVAVNDQQDEIKKFMKKFPEIMDRVVLVTDDENIYQKYFGTYKLPETYVFNSSLSLVRKFTGPQDWDKDFFKSFFLNLK